MRDPVLLGAEQVERAASRMGQAAESLSRSVGDLDAVLLRHRLELEQMLDRAERLVAALGGMLGGVT